MSRLRSTRPRARIASAGCAVALVVLGGGVGAADRSTDARRSGFEFMTPELQTMQRDDALNPGMLWIKDGEALWNR